MIPIRPAAHGAVILTLLRLSQRLLSELIRVRGPGDWINEIHGEFRLFARGFHTDDIKIDTVSVIEAAHSAVDEVFEAVRTAKIENDGSVEDDDR